MKKLITLQDFLTEARRLRNQADVSEREFLDFLRTFEGRRDLWQSSAETFDQLLSKNDICKPSRYRNWVQATNDEVIAPHIDEIGVNGAVVATRIRSPKKRAEAVEEMRKSVTLNGTVMSRQSAQRIVDRYEPRPSTLPDPNEKIAELQAENLRLRERVAKLVTECADLRAQLRAVGRSRKPGQRSRPGDSATKGA
jgi:hypothetical protein